MYTLDLNGRVYRATEDMNLLEFLRDYLGITSLKNGCGEGSCGACTVLVDGASRRACLLTVAGVEGRRLLTVEGLSEREKDIFVRAFGEAGAVQCGFCLPGLVLSAKALLDQNPAPSVREIRRAIRGHICRCTGYVKIEQAIGLASRLRSGGTLPAGAAAGVGASLPRVEVRDKVLGTGRYVDDLRVEGMLYGAVLRLPCARALVRSIDTAAARSHPEVAAVLTAADLPGARRWGFIVKDWPVLVGPGEETRYAGDAVALVAASSRRAAREALALIRVVYAERPPLTSPERALAVGAPALHPGGNLLSTVRINRGDTTAALARSVHVVTNRYRTPPTEHAFLEPESALAVPEADGRVTVHTGSQSVYEDRRGIAAILGLPEAMVRVVGRLVGGAFGGKEDLSVQHHAALLAQACDRPVKLTLTRRESILVHPKRHAMELELTSACDAAGRLTAVRARVVADTGAYASLGPAVLERACTHIGGPYHVPAVDVTGQLVYTNNPPAGAFRGFGVPQAALACETNLDLLAEKAGLSPWDIRWKNALEPGLTGACGQVADAGTALKETLLAVRETFEAHPGAGIACAMKNTGVGAGLPDGSRVEIRVENGKAVVLTSAACVGQGLATVLTQIVCQTAQLPPEAVSVAAPDTAQTPDAGTTTASRQTFFTGEAARRAALALARTGASLADLEGSTFAGEYCHPTDPLGSSKAAPVHHAAYGYATHVVWLDAAGRVAGVTAAHDVGRAVNPRAVEGQLEGGIVMGLGYALTEDFPLADGVPQARFATLGLLRSTDIPDIKVILVEKNPDPTCFGAKGVGEIAGIPVAPAVAAAYRRRDGKLRLSLPLTGTPYRRS
jgi:selenium-dependent xanthine dehydrogenase